MKIISIEQTCFLVCGESGFSPQLYRLGVPRWWPCPPRHCLVLGKASLTDTTQGSVITISILQTSLRLFQKYLFIKVTSKNIIGVDITESSVQQRLFIGLSIKYVNISCKTKVGIFSNTVRSVEIMGIKRFPQLAHIMIVERAFREKYWGEDQADNQLSVRLGTLPLTSTNPRAIYWDQVTGPSSVNVGGVKFAICHFYSLTAPYVVDSLLCGKGGRTVRLYA